MKTKLPQLTNEQKITVFKECISSLDPALALNAKFVNGVDPFTKRWNSKITYFRLDPDDYKRFVGKVSSNGNRVRLTLTSGRKELELLWHSKHPEKNVEAIKIYSKFKEISRAVREDREKEKAREHEKNEAVKYLTTLLPKNYPVYLSGSYGVEKTFNLQFRELPQEKIEIILQKIKDI